MKQLAFIFFLIFWSSQIQAHPMNGIWRGVVNSIDDTGKTYFSETLEIEIEIDNNELIIFYTGWSTIPATGVYRIQNGELLRGYSTVGIITDGLIETDFFHLFSDNYYRYKIILNSDGTLHFSDMYTYSPDVYTITEGIFYPVPLVSSLRH